MALFAALFPVKNVLLQKCHLRCKHKESASSDSNLVAFSLMKTISMTCFIKTPQTSNCTLDVSEVIQSSYNQEGKMIHYLTLVCGNTQYRPIITNAQNISCGNCRGTLHVKKCGLLWQDLDAYGESQPLHILLLDDYEDRWDEEIVETDYWKKHLNLRGHNEPGSTDTEVEVIAIPHGLGDAVILKIINMDHIPGILQAFVWPKILKVTLTNVQVSSQFMNSDLQTVFPRLGTLEVASCNLTQPPFQFPWNWKFDVSEYLFHPFLCGTLFSDTF